MPWSVVSTVNDSSTEVSARASLKLWCGAEGMRAKMNHVQGSVSLLRFHPEAGELPNNHDGAHFKLRVDAVARIDGKLPEDPGLFCEVPLPNGRWVVTRPKTDTTENGSFIIYSFKIRFEVNRNNALHGLKLSFPIADGNDEMQQLFFAAIMHANQEHVGSPLLLEPMYLG